MVFNDIASDTRVRHRGNTFYSGINLYAEIFLQTAKRAVESEQILTLIITSKAQ